MSALSSARPSIVSSSSKVVDLRRPLATASKTWRSSQPAARSASLTAARTPCSAASRSITTPALRPREGCCPTPSTSTGASRPRRAAATIKHTVLAVPMSRRPRIGGVCRCILCCDATRLPPSLSSLQAVRRSPTWGTDLCLAGAGRLAHYRPAGRAHVDFAPTEPRRQQAGRLGQRLRLTLDGQLNADAAVEPQRPTPAANAFGAGDASLEIGEGRQNREQPGGRTIGPLAGNARQRRHHVGGNLRQRAPRRVNQKTLLAAAPDRHRRALRHPHLQSVRE